MDCKCAQNLGSSRDRFTSARSKTWRGLGSRVCALQNALYRWLSRIGIGFVDKILGTILDVFVF